MVLRAGQGTDGRGGGSEIGDSIWEIRSRGLRGHGFLVVLKETKERLGLLDDLRIILCVVFGFGVVLESILLVGFDARELGSGIVGSTGASVLALIIGLIRAPELNLYTHVFISLVVFIGVFAIVFRRKILPVVNERTLLVLNLALWYVFLAYYPIFPQKLKILICLILIPMTISVNMMAFTDYVVGPALRLLFYMWFLIMIVFLGLAQFPIWNLSLFFDQMSTGRLGFLDVFLIGMVFCYIATHAIYILILIPIPYDSDRSFKSRWKEVKAHAKVLIEKYSYDQLKQEEALLIMLILGGLLAANLFLELVPDHLAINTLIVIVPQILSRRFSAVAEKAGERL